MLCLVCTFIGVTMVGEDELNGVHVGDIECCHERERERESIHLKIQNFDILNIQIYGYWNSNIQVFGFGFSYV